MAEYKQGNIILSQEEKDEEVLSLAGAVLFFCGAGLVIYFLGKYVPEGWAKEYRFLIIFPTAIGVGYLFSLLREQALMGVFYVYFILIWVVLGSIVWWLI